MHHGGAEGLVTTLQQRHPKTDLVEDQRQRTAALAAAPAVGQWAPLLGSGQQLALDVACYVARGQSGTAFFGLERVDLLVQGADGVPFGVVECGPVHCAGQVVLRVLVFAAGVDHSVKFMQPADGLLGAEGGQAHFKIFRRAGQTLTNIMGWAASVG